MLAALRPYRGCSRLHHTSRQCGQRQYRRWLSPSPLQERSKQFQNRSLELRLGRVARMNVQRARSLGTLRGLRHCVEAPLS